MLTAGSRPRALSLLRGLGIAGLVTLSVGLAGATAAASASAETLGRAHVHGTSASALATCDPMGDGCPISLYLKVTETLRDGEIIAVGAKATVEPGETKRTVGVGRSITVLGNVHSEEITVRLNATGRSLLATFHTLKVRFIAESMGYYFPRQTITFTEP